MTAATDHVTVTCSPRHLGQPLHSEAGPFQSMCHDEIVKKWRVLLPYFILLIDNTLLGCLVESYRGGEEGVVRQLWNLGKLSQRIVSCLLGSCTGAAVVMAPLAMLERQKSVHPLRQQC